MWAGAGVAHQDTVRGTTAEEGRRATARGFRAWSPTTEMRCAISSWKWYIGMLLGRGVLGSDTMTSADEGAMSGDKRRAIRAVARVWSGR